MVAATFSILRRAVHAARALVCEYALDVIILRKFSLRR